MPKISRISRMKSVFRRRRVNNNSLDLIRSLTIQRSVWLQARPPLPARTSRYYAELREDILLIYPAAQMLQYAANNFSPSRIERQPDFILAAIAQKIPSNLVFFFCLEAIRFVPLADTVLQLKSRNSMSARLIFDTAEERKCWMDAISSSLNCPKKQLGHFDVLKHIGKGASGRVYKVRDRQTSKILAMKVIDKAYAFESESSYRHAMDERIVLQIVRDHPFVLDMRYAFQNAKRLFLVTEFCGGGDMFEYLNRRQTPLSESTTRFVTAEVILAIEHLHSLGIVYRDLKLENVLIDSDGHIRLADFGLTKVLRQDDGTLRRTSTFCGTKEYVAPEMIRGDSYDMSLDFWAIGIFLYELMSGQTPFYHDDNDQIYDRIEKAPIFFPADLSSDARSLISSLLKRQPMERLGTSTMGLEEIKMHPWFKDTDWDAVRKKTLTSPLMVGLRFRNDASTDTASLSVNGKKRRQQQQKAMAIVMDDVEEDKRYFSSLESCISISSRPRSPMEKRGDGILAGYCFRNSRAITAHNAGVFVPHASSSSSVSKSTVAGSKSCANVSTERTEDDENSPLLNTPSAAIIDAITSKSAADLLVGQTSVSQMANSPVLCSDNSSTSSPKEKNMTPTSGISIPTSPDTALDLKADSSLSGAGNTAGYEGKRGGVDASSASTSPSKSSSPPSHRFPHLLALLNSLSSSGSERAEGDTSSFLRRRSTLKKVVLVQSGSESANGALGGKTSSNNGLNGVEIKKSKETLVQAEGDGAVSSIENGKSERQLETGLENFGERPGRKLPGSSKNRSTAEESLGNSDADHLLVSGDNIADDKPWRISKGKKLKLLSRKFRRRSVGKGKSTSSDSRKSVSPEIEQTPEAFAESIVDALASASLARRKECGGFNDNSRDVVKDNGLNGKNDLQANGTKNGEILSNSPTFVQDLSTEQKEQ